METPVKKIAPSRSDYTKSSPSSEARKMTEDEKKSFDEKLQKSFNDKNKYF